MPAIIVTTLYLLSIFIPLTFTTINHELFEFPKFILLLAGTSIISLSWIFHALKTKDFKFITPSPMTYAILAILATQTLATIFSLHPYTSFWGYYSRFHGGLLTTICYTIIYFSAVKWLDKQSTLNIIKISVITSILISLYAVLERLGINKDFWIQDVQNRVFSTLGQPNWLAAYLIPNIFLTLYLGHTHKKFSPYSILCFSLLVTALIFTRSRSGFIALVLSYATYWLLLIRQLSFAKLKKSLLHNSLGMVAIFALFGTPYTPTISSLLFPQPNNPVATTQSGTALETGGTESGDIRKIVWSGAIALIQQRPLIGTGPETFAYTYYWTRPVAHNLTSEWDFLYNKAHNEYLNIGATTGLLGLLAYLSWHLAMLLTSLTTLPQSKKVKHDTEDSLRHFYPVLAASLVGFTITNFFGFSVIPIYFLMVMLAALPNAQIKPVQATPTHYPTPIEIIILCLPLIYLANLFSADLNYAKGKQYLDAGQIETAIKYLDLAVKKRPGLDLYHATLAEAYSSSGQVEPALRHLRRNLELNPHHLNFYKSRAKTYLTLATLDPTYHAQAAQELEQSRKLAPTDPKLAYNLALVYTRLDELKLAEENLLDAIRLKPNYQEPYYALTLLYEQTKQETKIAPLLRDARTNLATYSSQLKDKINKYASD